VEVLVSMALILIIMSILAGAFAAASQAVGDLKAAGDLAEKLRGAANVLRRDLMADHFTDGVSDSPSPKLSDPTFWNRLDTTLNPPGPFGFFRIIQQNADQQDGGNTITDLDGIPSFSQTTTSLHYTVALSGTNRSDFLSATVPNGSPLLANSTLGVSNNLLGSPDSRYQDMTGANPYNSPFAEVVVFVQQGADSTDGGLPLFNLFRRQFLNVPTAWATANRTTSSANPAAHSEISTFNNQFNSLQDVAAPNARFGMNTADSAGTFAAGTTGYQTVGNASDLLLTDVLSFDVRVLAGSVNTMGVITRDTDFKDLSGLQNFNPVTASGPTGNNPAFPNGGTPFVFDTWTNQGAYSSWKTPGARTSIPMFQDVSGNKLVILAIQITLRVWDFKTKKTRQVTIVQQM
jgi:type II secretory pathway pseudopilin PulG